MTREALATVLRGLCGDAQGYEDDAIAEFVDFHYFDGMDVPERDIR